MGRCAAGLAVGLFAAWFPAIAWPAVTLSMTRSVEGLDENGFLQPGATSIDFVLTLTATGAPSELTAVAIEEQLPLNFAYASVDSAQRPDVIHFEPETGLLQFAWIRPPDSFPLTLHYRANILRISGETLEVHGHTSYRAEDGEVRTPDVVTELRLTPCLSFQRISAEGCYTPGATHDVEVTFSSTCPAPITALGLVDILPEGFTFVGVSGEDAPDVSQLEGRELRLGWVDIPQFPFTFVYSLTVPAQQEGDVTITGHALYRQDGPELTSAERVTILCGQDSTVPSITLLGSATMTTECGQPFEEPGATAFDNIDGDLSQDIVRSGEVDTGTPGQYQLIYNVQDREGNSATPQTRTVLVEDRTPPVIILRGPTTETVECHTNFNDAGVTATDLCEGDLTGQVISSGQVDTNLPGAYLITYTLSDSAGNQAEPVTRRIEVIDTTAPKIALIGLENITLECGAAFTDPGVTAADTCQGDLTEAIQVAGEVDTETPGAYTLTYTVEDAAHNSATPVLRRVLIVDTQAPQITLLGGPSVTIECGSVYEDAGATAVDSCAGDLTSALARVSNVDSSQPGEYEVTYNVTDGAGNAAESVVRNVVVRDTQPPVVRLNGNGVVNVPFGGSFTDPGATATDSCNGDLSARVTIDGSVNTQVAGRYVLTYSVSDDAGNEAEPRTREVNVVDNVRPVITLLGGSQVAVDCGSGPFDDPGATAVDNADGDLTEEIAVSGSVNTETPGEYTLTYNVSDAAGNAAQPIARRVTVRSTPARVVTVNILSPRGSVLVPQGRNTAEIIFNADLVLSQEVGCPEGVVEVTYSIGGQPVGASRERELNFPVPAVLPLGTHTLTASARTLATGAVAVSAPLQIHIAAGTDSDSNGLVDDPFAALQQEGDLWTSTGQDSGCPRGTQMLTWFGACQDDTSGRVNLTVAVPGDPTQAVSVSAPRTLAACGEQAVLIVSIACDLEGLFNAQRAQAFLPTPPEFIAGGSFFEVSLLISGDEGQSFTEVDDALLDAFPVTFSLSGLAFDEGQQATFYSHPTTAETDPVSGVQIEPGEGDWTSAFISNVAIEGGVMTAQTRRLSTFAPFEISTTGPLLSVEPLVGNQFFVGSAAAGATVEASLTLRNIGTGVLSGSAVITNNPGNAFQIIAGSNFELEANESQSLRILFTPAENAVYNGTLSITGDPEGGRTVQLRGSGLPANKPFAFLGCGPGGAEGACASDLLLAVMLGAILLMAARHGRGSQN